MNDESLFRPEAVAARRSNWPGLVVLAQPVLFGIFATIAVAGGGVDRPVCRRQLQFKRTNGRRSVAAGGWVVEVVHLAGSRRRDRQAREGKVSPVHRGDVLYVCCRWTVVATRIPPALPGSASAAVQQPASGFGKTRNPRRIEQRADLAAQRGCLRGRTRKSLASPSMARRAASRWPKTPCAELPRPARKDYIAAEQRCSLREADLIDQRLRLQALERDQVNVQRELTPVAQRAGPAAGAVQTGFPSAPGPSSTDQEPVERTAPPGAGGCSSGTAWPPR